MRLASSHRVLGSASRQPPLKHCRRRSDVARFGRLCLGGSFEVGEERLPVLLQGRMDDRFVGTEGERRKLFAASRDNGPSRSLTRRRDVGQAHARASPSYSTSRGRARQLGSDQSCSARFAFSVGDDGP